MESIAVNSMTVLATAMYCQLDALMSDAIPDGVSDFSVEVTSDKDPDGFFVDGICGYIETNHGGKETTLKFTITSRDFDDIHMTVTQDIDVNISEQDANGHVLPACFAPRPNEPTVWVDFGKRRVFYKWEDSLGMNIEDLDAKLSENKLALSAIAQDIIGTILAKGEPPKK